MATPTRKQGKTAERAALAAELAYSAARSDIEVNGISVKAGRRGGSRWYETALAWMNGGEEQAWIDRAVRYLDLAGLLQRDAKRASIVRVLDREPRG